jgi:hypothetical protein
MPLTRQYLCTRMYSKHKQKINSGSFSSGFNLQKDCSQSPHRPQRRAVLQFQFDRWKSIFGYLATTSVDVRRRRAPQTWVQSFAAIRESHCSSPSPEQQWLVLEPGRWPHACQIVRPGNTGPPFPCPNNNPWERWMHRFF